MPHLTDLQLKLLEMFCCFHNYCEDNDLKYYALGGTLLGAIRHNGFIPWDDDIDVGMPRDDYEKLQVLLQNDSINGRYILESPYSKDDNYIFPFTKLYDTNTTLIETARKQLVRGIYIDIFPLDGLCDTKQQIKKKYRPIQKRMVLLNLRRMKIESSRSFYKNMLLRLIHTVPERIISDKRMCVSIDDICKKRSFEGSNWGGNLVGAWGVKEVLPISVFGVPKLYQFESMQIYGPCDAEKYLTLQYGNWRIIPPKEKQVSHHDYYLDLDHGYLSNNL